jgi:hypothetical protein
MTPTPLVAVVGDVEPALLEGFVRHYAAAGVDDFLLGFHFTEAHPVGAELLARARELVGRPRNISRGRWVEGTNGTIRDALRGQAGSGWHVIADVDELQTHPASIATSIEQAVAAGERTVEGLLIDRVARDGELAACRPGEDLDERYPLGGFFTPRVLDADPRKVLVARADVPLGSGNHWAPGLRRGASSLPPLPVHHFKWRAGCADYLRRRARGFATAATAAEASMRRECAAALAHLDAHGGRIDVADAELGFTSCSTMRLPPNWFERAAGVGDHWWRERWILRDYDATRDT